MTKWTERPFDPMKDSLPATIDLEPEHLKEALLDHVYDDVDPALHERIVKRARRLLEEQARDLIEEVYELAIYEVVHEHLDSR